MAKQEIPLLGKRGPYRGGRVRSAQLRVNVAPAYLQRLDALAAAEGVTRTVLIERWIDEHASTDATRDVQDYIEQPCTD